MTKEEIGEKLTETRKILDEFEILQRKVDRMLEEQEKLLRGETDALWGEFKEGARQLRSTDSCESVREPGFYWIYTTDMTRGWSGERLWQVGRWVGEGEGKGWWLVGAVEPVDDSDESILRVEGRRLECKFWE